LFFDWLNLLVAAFLWWLVFLAGFEFCAAVLPVFPGFVVVSVYTFTESLILAQDERWRRA
jgi:hypothetical protein